MRTAPAASQPRLRAPARAATRIVLNATERSGGEILAIGLTWNISRLRLLFIP